MPRETSIEERLKGESVTIFEWEEGEPNTHGGGWGGGTSVRNVEIDNLDKFDTFAVYTYEACQDHKGCNEWDFIDT